MGISRRRFIAVVVVIGVLLVAARAVLPVVIKRQLNTTLAQLDGYSGRVDDVDMALWRGAYRIEGIVIDRLQDDNPVPLIRTRSLDLSLSWRALFQGEVLAEIVLVNPQVNFVDEAGEDDQTGEDLNWRQLVKDLVPITINRLDIRDGAVRFYNFATQPPVEVALSDLQVQVSNITNAARESGEQQAHIEGQGQVLGHAPFEVYGILDPLGDFENFDINLKITGFDLRRLNDLTKAYANFDFQSGSGDFIMELRAQDAQLEGYAKPLLDNVDILELSESQDGEGLWEALVASLAWLFRNHDKDRLGSQIEIEGNLRQDNVSAWQAFVSILHNAFIEAYESRFGRE